MVDFFTAKQLITQIINKPLGHGIDSFALEYNKSKAAYFSIKRDWSEMKNAGYLYNANNDFLELTFEFGIIWIVIFSVFIVLVFCTNTISVNLYQADSLLLCLLSFSLTGTILLLPLLTLIAVACLTLKINGAGYKVLLEINNSGKLLYFAISTFLICTIFTRVIAEHKLSKIYDGRLYYKGSNQIANLVSKIDHQGEELFLATAILFNARNNIEGNKYLTVGFARSGKPSSGRIYASILHQQGLNRQAEAIYTYNKNVEPYRYEARMDLLNLFIKTNQKHKAIKMAKEIINLPIKIPSSTIEIYKQNAKAYLYQGNSNKKE